MRSKKIIVCMVIVMFIPTLIAVTNVSGELVFELDSGQIPSYVGGGFYLTITAFDSTEHDVVITASFDSSGIAEPLIVFQESRLYFVNDEIFIPTSGDWGQLDSGHYYNFTIWAEDYLGNTITHNEIVQIDITPPTIEIFTINLEPNEDGEYVLGWEQSLSIHWVCNDNMRFRNIRIYANDIVKEDVPEREGTRTIAFDLPDGVIEQKFTIELRVYDMADNWFSDSYDIIYKDTRDYDIDAQTQKERVEALTPIIIWSIILGVGVIVGLSLFAVNNGNKTRDDLPV